MEQSFTGNFNTLPTEQQIEIMKNKPFFRRLNKKFYNNSKLIFDNQYCDINISGNEIIHYIKTELPDFAVFYINDEIVTIKICFKEEDGYFVFTKNLYYDNVDMGEYKLLGSADEQVFSVDELLDTLISKNMYIDIQSVMGIIKLRGCNNEKRFAVNYLNDLIQLKSGGDMGKLFITCVKTYYTMISYDIIESFYNGTFIEVDDVTFDDMGNVFEDDEQQYDEHFHNNNDLMEEYYDKIIEWINM